MHIIGFIGAGNIATAMMKGMLKGPYCDISRLSASDMDKSKLDKIEQDLGIHVFTNNTDLVKHCDVVFLAVKPHVMGDLLIEIKQYIASKIIISVVLGWSCQNIQSVLSSDADTQIACIMPNTSSLVREGITAILQDHTLSHDAYIFIHRLLSSIGRVTVIPENMLSSFVAVCGSGPAYIYMLIEALSDAAVKEGLSRSLAYEVIVQTVKGAAEMILETGEHPAVLKDAVCSPSGATIEAITELEKNGFRSALIQAVSASAAKTRDVSNRYARIIKDDNANHSA